MDKRYCAQRMHKHHATRRWVRAYIKCDRIVIIFVITLIPGITLLSLGMYMMRGVHGFELLAEESLRSITNVTQHSHLRYIGADFSENNQTAVEENSTTIGESSNLYETDSDDDGLTDYQESEIYHTNPLNQDSDGDGLPDGKEIKGWAWEIEERRADGGCMIVNQCTSHKTNPMRADTDGDGNDDYFEYSNFPSDPLNPDQDHETYVLF